MKATVLALLIVSTPAVACVVDDYQQVKDELATQGRPAMIARYCSEFQLVKGALSRETDFTNGTSRSRAEARADYECHSANLDRMKTALGAKTDTEILNQCPK